MRTAIVNEEGQKIVEEFMNVAEKSKLLRLARDAGLI